MNFPVRVACRACWEEFDIVPGVVTTEHPCAKRADLAVGGDSLMFRLELLSLQVLDEAKGLAEGSSARKAILSAHKGVADAMMVLDRESRR